MIVSFINAHLLTLAILLPFVGAGVVLTLPHNKCMLIRTFSVIMSLVVIAIAGLIFMRAGGSGEFVFVDSSSWIPSLGISYHVGVDSASALMILVAAALAFVSFLSGKMTDDPKLKMVTASVFVVQGGAIGVFSSLDVFLFCVFWQIILVPMCLLIGSKGTSSRVVVAMKFMAFAVAAGLLMSVAVMYCGIKVGSFNLMDWYATGFGTVEQFWLFGTFAFAFAIWVPILGLHTWMPDAVVKAPAAAGVLLLGLMTSLGAYGFFRIAMPLFPQAVSSIQMPLIIVATACIVCGALLAIVQSNLKKLIAYSTISQMGLVMLGFFVLSKSAAMGALFFMAGRALVAGVAFMLVGSIEERAGSYDIGELGGIAVRAPMLSVFFVGVVLAMIGLPPLMNFAGSFAILLGSFQVQTFVASIALVGLAILSIALIWMLQRVLFGRIKGSDSGRDRTSDARAHEYAVIVPVAILIVVLGIVPYILMARLQNSADIFVRFSKRAESSKVQLNDMVDFEYRIQTDD